MQRILEIVRHYLYRHLWPPDDKKRFVITAAMMFMALAAFVPQAAQALFIFVWCWLSIVLVRLYIYDPASLGISAVAARYSRGPIIQINRVKYHGGVVGLMNLRTGTWTPLEEGDLLMLMTTHNFPKDEDFPDDPC